MNPINPEKLPDTDEIVTKIAAIRLRLNDPDMIELKKKDKLEHRVALEKEFFDFFDKMRLVVIVVEGGKRPLAIARDRPEGLVETQDTLQALDRSAKGIKRLGSQPLARHAERTAHGLDGHFR